MAELSSTYATESCNELKEAYDVCIDEKLECNTNKDVQHEEYTFLYNLCAENCTEAIQCIAE